MGKNNEASAIGVKCLKCGGSIQFEPTTQMVVCESCGSKKGFNEIDDESGITIESRPWEDDDAVLYHCPSCGGDLIYNKNSISSKCPYCKSNLILGDRLEGFKRPDGIIPFKLDESEATARMNSFMNDTGMSSKALSKCTTKRVEGVYVPFWTYSSRVIGYVNFICRYRLNDDYTVKDVECVAKAAFHNVPVDASEKLPNEYSESIDPFDFKEMEHFDSKYLLGYAAEKYDVEPIAGFKRARQRMSEELVVLMKDTYNKKYDSAREQTFKVKAPTTVIRYVLCPVWRFEVDYKGETFHILVNGQTGKVGGSTPAEKGIIGIINRVTKRSPLTIKHGAGDYLKPKSFKYLYQSDWGLFS